MIGGQTAESLAGFLGRHRLPVLLIFSILFVGPLVVRAAAKPLWHDEIYTVLLARLPTLSAHWTALHDGPDLAPPLNAFATRVVLSVVGVGHVTTRIPAMVGSLTMTLAVFTMVFKRSNATLALAGACIPFFTAAYRYSYEARPYGLMMGLAALAWMAWSESAAERRRGLNLPILGLSLAAGLWNHYFAALVYVPIGIGEVVRSVRARRIDGVLWAVIAASLAAALPLYPLIRLSAEQSPSFWSRPSIGDIPAAYRFLFGTLADTFTWAIAAIAILIVIARFRSSSPTPSRVTAAPHEVAAAIACLLLPLFGVLLALFATGAFIPRYGLSTVAGVSVIVPLVVGRLARRAPICEIVLLIALAGVYVSSLAQLFPVPRFQNPVNARPLLLTSLQMPGPTVSSSELWYLQLWYYAPPSLKPRLVYLADPASARRYRGSDMIDRGYIALSHWVPLPVEPFDAFVQRQQSFRVYATGASWLLDRLRDEHAAVAPRGTEPGGQLYDASLPSPPPSLK